MDLRLVYLVPQLDTSVARSLLYCVVFLIAAEHLCSTFTTTTNTKMSKEIVTTAYLHFKSKAARDKVLDVRTTRKETC
jgi:hypothetical protein